MAGKIKKVLRSARRILVTVAAIVLIGYISSLVYEKNFSPEAQDKYIQEIYSKIVASSGLSEMYVPLSIVERDSFNAFTDGDKVVVYRGLINVSSWDTIAFVLAHEYAHVTLSHSKSVASNDVDQQVREALADKLGAVYMMQAGFNICKARESWKGIRKAEGNYLGLDHPNYSYRYDELNINCE